MLGIVTYAFTYVLAHLQERAKCFIVMKQVFPHLPCPLLSDDRFLANALLIPVVGTECMLFGLCKRLVRWHPRINSQKVCCTIGYLRTIN